ncbi:MAG: hypothetical protein Q9166_003635 [cf. Caloplaca sp. 2 TL-2023]
MSQPEILVHAAAPSHGSDDVRYRKEASGVLSFEAVKKHDILPGGWGGNKTRTTSPGQISQNTQQSLAQAQDSITSNDPAPRHHVIDALSTWMTPTLPHPSPRILIGKTPDPILLKQAPGLAGHILIEQTPANQQRPQTAPSGPSVIQATPPLRRSFSDAFETPPSEIPDSQPAPYFQQDDDRTFEECSSPSPTRKEERFAKRWKGNDGTGGLLGHGTPPDDTSTPPMQDTLQPSPPPANAKISTPHPPSSASKITQSTVPQYRRRKVDPPPPEPSIRTTVVSHLTSSLNILRQQCTKILQPVRPLRPLHPLERGHWRLNFQFDDDEIQDKTKWNRLSRERMWSDLEKFVGRGCGGWALWATFEEGKVERFDGGNEWIGEKGDQEESMGADDGPAIGRVKIFCYGEVVLEVYALLVLATDRRIKRCGAQWLDSNMEVAVDMRGD